MNLPHLLGTVVLAAFLPWAAHAADPGKTDKDEWLRGKLFGPELILKHQGKLKLSEKQLDIIGAELKRVQSQVAESDWKLLVVAGELQELIDQHPVDQKEVMARVNRVFDAENLKKRLYLEMLIHIKNTLTEDQVKYLRDVSAEP
jgi:hypothetical protein